MLSPEYIAGFLDADGSFALLKNKVFDNRWGNSYIQHKGYVAVSLTYYPTLKKLQDQYGGYLMFNKHASGKKPCWQWKLSKRDNVIILLNDVLPFLEEKKEQAQLLLEYLEWRKIRPYNGSRWRPIDFSEVAWMFDKMKKLKHEWVSIEEVERMYG